MNWDTGASRHYQGPIDRVYVSLREMHHVDFFIDAYLRRSQLDLSDDNRRMVGEKLEQFLGRVPYRWDDLTDYLDGRWRGETETVWLD